MTDFSVICMTDSMHGILHRRHTAWGGDSVMEEVLYWWLCHNHCYWWLGHIYCYWQLYCDTVACSFATMLLIALLCANHITILMACSHTR
ncbi:hypothetical protein Goshw_028625 [Gossypium schwendimanii]|uniref:Uncharacterized protein n=1 Tax=Gossypium schwendimanii TaxID=34291 RepID=A0A7J9LCS9_GOSSC|nr:hypothetical protein [Gossypium schwendimanii]